MNRARAVAFSEEAAGPLCYRIDDETIGAFNDAGRI
jgi:hypothetical protein